MSDLHYRILIVDDNAEDRDIYRLHLCKDEECDYAFEEADMGADGLQKALTGRFDCILLDYMLPDLDGLEFLRRLQAATGIGHAPVVMITGQGNEGIAVQALRLGAQDYLVKSHISPEAIYRATRNAIDRREQENRLAAESEKTKALQEQLTLLVEGARDHALILLDAAGAITKWNSGATAVTGYREEEVLGLHIGVLYRASDIAGGAAEAELRRAESAGRFDVERWMCRKGAIEFWATGSVSALRHPDGSVRGFAKIIRDDTVRKRMLEEHANQQKWLESVLDFLPVAFILLEPKSGRVLFANRAANALAGGLFPYSESTADYARNYRVTDIDGNPFPHERHPWVRAALGDKLDSNDLSALVWETPTRSEHLLASSETLPPLFGREPVIILSLQNITQLRQTQHDLMKAKSSAEGAAIAKSAFLANMSHEIRTPLAAIMGFAELGARERASVAERARYADIIKRNGEILMQLIDGILDLSKIEAGRLELDNRHVDLRQLVADVLDIHASQAAAKGVSTTADFDARLPASVITDPVRLKQILYNVIGNALKFTERGQVALSVTLAPEAPPRIVFSVRDTGIGIAPEHQQRLFQPFTQADASTTRKYGGTGLGLVLCARLASALGGRFLLADSRPGVGSVFQLMLPLDRQSSMDESAQPPSAAGRHDVQGARILLVEDSIDTQALFLQVLQQHGALVATANDGQEALRKAADTEFDLIVMDIQMAVMDGYTATRRLRESGFTRPILGLTANIFKEDRERSRAAGMDEHLTKPIGVDALIAKLAAHLGRGGAWPPSSPTMAGSA